MDIKKILIPGLIVVVAGIFIIYQLNGNQNSLPPVAPTQGYKDGQYTGDVVSNNYGDVQVEAIINGGKITDVQFLTYPNHAGHSQEISNYSMPLLKQEAIQAQSARVDIVSGATQTSESFIQSLSSALAKAV
jgi:uncharacterized protein with FMN-binding domain